MSPPSKVIKDEYEILEELGQGGMANVYKAKQTSLDRVVAIKEIKPAYTAHPELVERFKREARIAASIVHQNIVQVYNFGEPKKGSLFIVLEYVPGHDLKTLLAKKGPLPVEVAAIIVGDTARALAFAHSKGLVHRDVKPGNIMISESGEVKLMDFGIVREMDSDLTRTGAFLGTPSYMSPEQFLGEQITAASDIFSLGIVLYETLTGQKPFRGDNEASLSKKVRTEKEARVRDLNPRVPRKVQGVTHKCLMKSPGRRFGSGEELCAALDKCLSKKSRLDRRKVILAWLGAPAAERAPLMAKVAAPPEKAYSEIRLPTREEADDARTAASVRSTSRAAEAPPRAKPSFEEPPSKNAARAMPVKKAAAPRAAPPPRSREIEEDTTSGETILKWMWRGILLAIAALAAVIAFMVLSNREFLPAPIKNVIERALPAESETDGKQ